MGSARRVGGDGARRGAALFFVLSLVAGLGAFYLAFQLGTARFAFFFQELSASGAGMLSILAAHVAAEAA